MLVIALTTEIGRLCMTNKPRPWNIYETVILLDAFFAIKDGLLSRADTIKKVSSDLRKMALNQGLEIDQTFRNENGISLQIHNMKSVLCEQGQDNHASKLFIEVVRVYRENQDKYQKLLKEAKMMIERKEATDDNFMQYLSEKVPPSKISELCSYYSDIDTFCRKIGILKKPLFETNDFETIKKVQRTIEQNKIFRVTRKKHHAKIVAACRYYYIYVRERQSKGTDTLLVSEKKFQNADSQQDEIVRENGVFVNSDTSDTGIKTVSVSTTTLVPSVSALSLEEKVKNALREETKENSYGTTVSYLQSQIRCDDSPGIKHILDNSEWAKIQFGRYFYVEKETVENDHGINIAEIARSEEKITVQNTDDLLRVNFDGTNDLAYTKPDSFTYFGEEKIFGATWTDLYVTFVATIHEDYPHLLKPGMSFSHNEMRIELAANTEYGFMIAPKPIPGTNLMLETNISANGIATKIKFILNLCNVDYENVEISYRKRNTLVESEAQNASGVSSCITSGITATTQTPTKDDIIPKQQLKESGRTNLSDIEQIVLQADMDGMSYDDLKDALQITMVLTRQLVAQSTKIVDIKGTLFHEEAFIDWEDGADALEAIIEKLMQKNNGYTSSTQLFEYARTEMNMFLNDNDMREERAVYDMAQHLFEKVHYHEKVFAFRGKMHISCADAGIGSNFDVYKKYAADQGGVFNLNGLIEYLESIGVSTGNLRNQMRMWTEPIFFFYDDDVIATAEALRIDEDWKKIIKKSLDVLFDDAGDHMILRNIPSIWFDRLPAISGNRPWTPLLLQSVLRFYNKELGARTIQALDSQSLETLHTMLVAKDSPIQNFGDVVISYLLEQNIERRKFEAEELRLLLADGGILHGNELIWNMPKALKGDGRFAWDASGNYVTVKI